ncbi:MAG: OmpA family protein [Flavobacteriales bacterium]|nr:OmpA family protein [Flavobacteriales bacterium]
MKTKHLLVIAAIVLGSADLFAQQNFTMYTMPYIQQRAQSNPALTPKADLHIGLPILSSTYFSFGNTGFKYSDLIRTDADDSLYFDFDNVLDKMADKNYLSASVALDYLTIGKRIDDHHYVSLSISEKFLARFTYPKDFFEFGINGNYPTIGNTLNFNFGIDMAHYREIGIGYAWSSEDDHFEWGFKLKYINGISNFETGKFDILLHTDPDDVYTLTTSGDIELNSSGVTNGFPAYSNGFPKMTKNHGGAIDLGFEYNFHEKWHINGSIIDLGFIKWQDNVSNIKSSTPGQEYAYNGIDLNDFIKDDENNTVYDGFDNIKDTLLKVYGVDTTYEAYSTYLSSQYHLGLTYDLAYDMQLGAHGYMHIFDNNVFPGVSVYFDKEFGEWCTLALSYTVYNRSWNNIGLGARINLGPIQYYIISDNVLGMFQPQNTKYLTLRSGVNLTFGRGGDKDGDGIKDKKDKCPEIPGIEAFEGCPDTDLDGIQDSEDMCPTVYGIELFHGCPDTDGDGIGDLDDDCVDIPGVAEFNGCPDTDGDGISDFDDECPELPGTKEHDGCPDTDGDGIVDSMDECPEKPGSKVNFGCPITKLSAINAAGLILMTVEMNDEGFFVFENLPPDEKYLFEMDGEDVFLTDELMIILKNGDEQEIIIAQQSNTNTHNYDYLPAEKTGLELFIVDDQGNIIRTATIDKKGTFVFENLPTDKNYTFRMDGEDVSLDEIQVLIKNADGDYMMTIKKDERADFDFQFLPNDQYGLALVEYSDEGTLVVLSLEEKEVVKEAFDHLEYNHGSAIISQRSHKALDELAQLLKNHTTWNLVLDGHTDDSGGDISNLALSQRRAEAVKRRLVEDGIDASRIIVKYHGESVPIADNSTEEGRQKNRRVEMEIVEAE